MLRRVRWSSVGWGNLGGYDVMIYDVVSVCAVLVEEGQEGGGNE